MGSALTTLCLPAGIEARDYQQQAWLDARAAFKAGQRPVIVAPTGSGKTMMGAIISASAVSKGSLVLWIAHRRELLFQAQARMEVFGLRCGLILAGRQPDPGAPVQIAGIDTLRRRDLPSSRVVILDECHRGRAKTVQRVLEHYQAEGAAIIGLTATPQRTDGKGLKPVFTALVETVDGDQLREQGILVPLTAYGLDDPDMSGVKTGADGDYDDEASAGIMRQLSGRIVKHWLKHAKGRRTLVFACTIEHSLSLRKEFKDAGIEADHVDGKTPKAERAAKFDRLSLAETEVLCNVGVCVEGIDLPALGAIVMARPTKSLTLFLQSVGRGVRCFPGKVDCVLLDHAGNCARLGHPEDPHEWSLDDRKKPPERKPAICPQCSRVRKPKEQVCPCGFVWPLSEIRHKPPPKQMDDELEQVGRRRRVWATATAEQRRQRYTAWLAQASLRGFKLGWARHRYRATFGDWPNGLHDLEAEVYGDRVGAVRPTHSVASADAT